jgi:hypothetical protein
MEGGFAISANLKKGWFIGIDIAKTMQAVIANVPVRDGPTRWKDPEQSTRQERIFAKDIQGRGKSTNQPP